MKKMFLVGMMLLMTVLLSTPAVAGLSAGQLELGGFMSYSSPEDSEDNLILSANLSMLVTQQIQVGGSVMYLFADAPSGGDETLIASLLGTFKYNFAFSEAQTTVPYVGAQVGLTTIDVAGTDDTSYSFGTMGGVKFFLSEATSLNLELNYLLTDYDGDTTSNTSVLAGISFYFGG